MRKSSSERLGRLTSTAVDLNLSGVGREAIGRILGGDTALEGEATGGDVVLCEAELLERGAGSNLDLSGNNVDAGNFFGDGMLDLAA